MVAAEERPDEVGAVTQLLDELKDGRREAFDELLPHIYTELREIAHRQRWAEREDHTLSTTALVHEAYLKLADQRKMSWESRAHFFAVAAQAMRRVLVSYARGRNAAKRGGGAAQVTIERVFNLAQEDRALRFLDLDEALTRLEALNPRHARVVECRFFAGLTVDETAHALDMAAITVTRDWRMARAWLKVELEAAG